MDESTRAVFFGDGVGFVEGKPEVAELRGEHEPLGHGAGRHINPNCFLILRALLRRSGGVF